MAKTACAAAEPDPKRAKKRSMNLSGPQIAEQLRLFADLSDQPQSQAPTKADMIKRLRALQSRCLLPVAPGLYRTLRDALPPEIVISRMEDRGNGVYEVVPVNEQWIRLTADVMKAFGFTTGRGSTLFRLARAGFIEVVPIAPHTNILNLSSLYGHLARVAEDPEFWDEDTPQGKARMKAYRETMF